MDRSRSAGSTALWVLTVVLTIVFLAAGIPKVFGLTTPWLQAAALRGFPEWIRVVVGVVEIVGALALLVPALAPVAAIVLALLMLPATVTQRLSGESGMWVPAVLFVLLLIVAWWRTPAPVRDGYRSAARAPHPILREGVIAGLIGATVIALWFLIVDAVAGHPLYTPAVLGHALLGVLGPIPAGESMALHVAVYTAFHYIAFIVAGIILAVIVRAAGREPSLLFGALILVVAFEVGFYGLVGLLQLATPLGVLAWYQVMIGNVLAALAMGTYLWRAHPALRKQFSHQFQAHA